MSDDPSVDDRPPRLPDQILEAVRRHAEEPELAVHSLKVWAGSQPEWQYDPAFEIDAVQGAVEDLPDNLIEAEGREAGQDVVASVFQERSGRP
jgi:hypothetical protein